MGLAVPADVSVVGFDDSAFMNCTDPPLTTIHTPYDDITAANFQLLLHMIDPTKWPEPVLTAKFSLIVRASTGPAPRRGRASQRGRRALQHAHHGSHDH